MASGRLGSAYVDAKRTSQVYANSSGGAVALSIMAQAKSTTANVPLSIKVDNGSTAAETETQIDSSSYTEQALKLTYNSGITATTGALQYSSYATVASGNKTIQLVPPSGTTTGTDLTGYTMPLCTDPTFTNWKGFEDNTLYPLYRSGSNPARWVSVAQAETAGSFDFISSQINQNYANFPTTTINGGLSYNSYGVVADPYCETLPIFGYQGSNYMSVRHVTGASTSAGWNKTSNSVFAWANGNSSSGSNQPQKHIFASGGLFVGANTFANRIAVRYYGMNPSNDIIEQTIANNFGSTGNNNYYPLDIWVNAYGTFEGGYPNVIFVEYNPFVDKIFTLMNFGESIQNLGRKLYEWQPTKLAALLENTVSAQPYGSSSAGYYIGDDYQRLIDDGLVIDRTSNLPDGPMTSATCRMYAPMKRVQNQLWTFSVADPYASNTDHVFYKTSDFLTYTEISSTEYYNELIDDDTTVLSNGTVTNKIVSNYSSLPDAGILEHQTSVNNYERTGLVLSNNDKLYVRNHGDTGVAVSVMGYEE